MLHLYKTFLLIFPSFFFVVDTIHGSRPVDKENTITQWFFLVFFF